MFGRKKKDEVSRKREANKKVPYKKCGHKRSYKKNGMTITVHCTKNRNVSHSHD